MTFAIFFTGEQTEVGDSLGRIQIGEFTESFISPTIFWSEARYMAQWQGGLRYLLAGQHQARLLTSVYPAGSAFAMCWTLYRVKQQIYIQNNLILCTQQKFDPTRPHQFIRPRQTHTAEGHHISEWQTSLDQLQAFLDTLPPPNFDQL
jgi:hypothetical protein